MSKVPRNQRELEALFSNVNKAKNNKDFSGIIKVLNYEYVDCSYENKESTFLFPVSDWQLNPRKLLQGGFLNTFFDTALAFTVSCFSDADDYVVTLDMYTDFIKPIPGNDSVLIKSKIISNGHTIKKTTSEARLKSNNKLVATCDSKFMIVKGKVNDIRVDQV